MFSDAGMLRTVLCLMNKVKKLYDSVCADAGEPFGLTQAEMDVLLFLANNKGMDTAMDIVKYRGISKSLVSRAVEFLVERGYVMVMQDGEDRRLNRLSVTQSAKPAIQALQCAQKRFWSMLMGSVEEEERAAVKRAIQRLSIDIDGLLGGKGNADR